MVSVSEENYLKTIYKLTRNEVAASTTMIGKELSTKASSVTDMVKKLSAKGLLNYTKYQGVSLTKKGLTSALLTIRKHRLWECFLHDNLGFPWHEVHSIAEELEHINSVDLIDRLEKYLGYPTHDPHGDPIPDINGKLTPLKNQFISNLKIGDRAIVVGVKDSTPEFLVYLKKIELVLGTELKMVDIVEFDNSRAIELKTGIKVNISERIAKNIFVKKR